MSEFFFNVAFLALAGLTAISGILVVSVRNILHAAVSLFFCLGGVAGLYILLGADFLGFTQLLVYAGGVLVLIIFGVFMTAKIYDTPVRLPGRPMSEKMGLLIAAGVFFVMASVIMKTDWPTQEPVYANTAHKLGDLFLTKYLLPFELISLLLLFAMIGAVMLVRKETREGN